MRRESKSSSYGRNPVTTKARWLLLISVAISVCAYGAEKKVTLEGQLVSASCYLSDGATGNDMGGTKECGSGCLRQGKPGGLLTKENSFYILDGPSLRLAPYVGRRSELPARNMAETLFPFAAHRSGRAVAGNPSIS